MTVTGASKSHMGETSPSRRSISGPRPTGWPLKRWAAATGGRSRRRAGVRLQGSHRCPRGPRRHHAGGPPPRRIGRSGALGRPPSWRTRQGTRLWALARSRRLPDFGHCSGEATPLRARSSTAVPTCAGDAVGASPPAVTTAPLAGSGGRPFGGREGRDTRLCGRPDTP